jgi:hypothetical protein
MNNYNDNKNILTVIKIVNYYYELWVMLYFRQMRLYQRPPNGI